MTLSIFGSQGKKVVDSTQDGRLLRLVIAEGCPWMMQEVAMCRIAGGCVQCDYCISCMCCMFVEHQQ